MGNENNTIAKRTQYILRIQVIFLQGVRSRLCTQSPNFCNSADDMLQVTLSNYCERLYSAIHLCPLTVWSAHRGLLTETITQVY